MRIPQDERFREERARFALRFTCEDCALFDALHGRCAHDYPVDEHLAEHYEDKAVAIVFCKDFDLL